MLKQKLWIHQYPLGSFETLFWRPSDRMDVQNWMFSKIVLTYLFSLNYFCLNFRLTKDKIGHYGGVIGDHLQKDLEFFFLGDICNFGGKYHIWSEICMLNIQA